MQGSFIKEEEKCGALRYLPVYGIPQQRGPTGRLSAAIVIYSAVLGSPLVGLFSIASLANPSRNSCEIGQESDDVVRNVGFGPHVLESRR
jgi:hypothetical protein